jgi:cytochrome P450
MCMTNFGAGVETIGITVSTLIAAVVRNGCQDRIYYEITTALKEGRLSKTPKLRELQNTLPYLNACIQESMRLHAAVGMPLVRVVPDGGVELEGKFLPAGVRFRPLLRNTDFIIDWSDRLL